MDIKLIRKNGRISVHPDCEAAVTDQPPWWRHAIHHQLCRAHYTQEQKSPPTGERALAESGVAVFRGLLETGEATDLSQRMGGAIAVKREDADPTQAAASDKEAGTEFITFDANLRAVVTLKLPRILNETVTAALERYFGSYFRIDFVQMYRTFPVAEAKASFHWHRDLAPMAQILIMVYLTDSGAHSGSTSFLDLEQTRAAAQAGYSFPNLDERIAEIDKVFAACDRPPAVNRPELAAGDAVAFAAPRVLHRGNSPETGFRDALLLILQPSFVPWSWDIDNFGSDYMFPDFEKDTIRTNPFKQGNPEIQEPPVDKSMIELWIRDGALFARDIVTS